MRWLLESVHLVLTEHTLAATLRLFDRICDVALCFTDEEIKAMSWTTFVAGCCPFWGQPVKPVARMPRALLITQDKLSIYKRPCPARCMRSQMPEDAWVVLGHTRMTTQGSERKNYNNDLLINDGMNPMEIEEMLYCG